MLLNELKRRKVLPVLGAYLAAAWFLMKIGEVVIPTLELPGWAFRALVVLLVAGLPLAGLSAWLFEVTDEGVKLQSDLDKTGQSGAPVGRALTIFSITCVVLAIALTGFTYMTAAPTSGKGVAEGEFNAAPANAIAVLPFVNLSNDDENQYFADGLAEELLGMLAEIHQLRVAGRTSSFSLRDSELDLATIGRKLNVSYVLEGSVRKAGARIRVSARLLDVSDGHQLWSEKYDRAFKGVFDLQADVADKVVDALKVSLVEGQLGVSPHAAGVPPEAYDLYLQARYMMHRRSNEDTREAVVLLRRALAIAPDFAAARATLSLLLSYRAVAEFDPKAEGLAAGETEARRALALDERLVLAYNTLGGIAMFRDRDWAAAREYYNRALAISPNNPDVLDALGNLEGILGRLDLAVSTAVQARELDPLSVKIGNNLMFKLAAAGDIVGAIEEGRRVLALNPKAPQIRAQLAKCLARNGQSEEALGYLESEPSAAVARAFAPLVHQAIGQTEKAESALTDFIEQNGEAWAFQIAEASNVMGHRQQALDWLERAEELGDAGLVYLQFSENLRELHGEARFQRLMEKLGLKYPEV